MQHTTIAVDLAKSVFQVAVSHHTGRVDEEHRLTRARFLRFFAQRPAATVLLEACGSAHHWARTLEQLGHTVQLLPPHETRRSVRRNKTDRADAKALLEAARNEEIHPVPVKSVSQQAVASLHRVRTTWVRTRTARLNTLRGLLREFGVTIPVGARHVVPQVRALVEDAEASVPMALRPRKVRLMGRGPVSAGRVSQVISGHAACATVPRSHVRWLGEPPPRRSDRVSPGGESGPPGAPGPSAASPDRCPTPSTHRARPETRTARLDAGRRHRHA